MPERRPVRNGRTAPPPGGHGVPGSAQPPPPRSDPAAGGALNRVPPTLGAPRARPPRLRPGPRHPPPPPHARTGAGTRLTGARNRLCGRQGPTRPSRGPHRAARGLRARGLHGGTGCRTGPGEHRRPLGRLRLRPRPGGPGGLRGVGGRRDVGGAGTGRGDRDLPAAVAPGGAGSGGRPVRAGGRSQVSQLRGQRGARGRSGGALSVHRRADRFARTRPYVFSQVDEPLHQGGWTPVTPGTTCEDRTVRRVRTLRGPATRRRRTSQSSPGVRRFVIECFTPRCLVDIPASAQLVTVAPRDTVDSIMTVLWRGTRAGPRGNVQERQIRQDWSDTATEGGLAT